MVMVRNATLENVAIQSPAMLFDVNRDGAKDALIAGLAVGQMNNHLRALDAHTGETLWQTDDLTDVRQGPEFAWASALAACGASRQSLRLRCERRRFGLRLHRPRRDHCRDPRCSSRRRLRTWRGTRRSKCHRPNRCTSCCLAQLGQ
jgi:hypothetical protein